MEMIWNREGFQALNKGHSNEGFLKQPQVYKQLANDLKKKLVKYYGG
jgi:hypothetical protein